MSSHDTEVANAMSFAKVSHHMTNALVAGTELLSAVARMHTVYRFTGTCVNAVVSWLDKRDNSTIRKLVVGQCIVEVRCVVPTTFAVFANFRFKNRASNICVFHQGQVSLFFCCNSTI